MQSVRTQENIRDIVVNDDPDTSVLERAADPKNVEQRLAAAELQITNLRLEIKSARAERLFAATEVSRIATERNEARREAKKNEHLLQAARTREAELERELEKERNARIALYRSLSWRVTKPLRAIARVVRLARRRS